MTEDRFVIKYFDSINSNVKLFKSKQFRNNIATKQSKLDKNNNSLIKSYKRIKIVENEILDLDSDLNFNINYSNNQQGVKMKIRMETKN